MINIAEMFFGVKHEEIENIDVSKGDDVTGFNREIMCTWAYRNSVQITTHLYNAVLALLWL